MHEISPGYLLLKVNVSTTNQANRSLRVVTFFGVLNRIFVRALNSIAGHPDLELTLSILLLPLTAALDPSHAGAGKNSFVLRVSFYP